MEIKPMGYYGSLMKIWKKRVASLVAEFSNELLMCSRSMLFMLVCFFAPDDAVM